MYRVTLVGGTFIVHADDEDEARRDAIQTLVESPDLLLLVRVDPDDPIEQYGDPVDEKNALHVMRALTKALLVRVGGHAEFTGAELETASLLNVYLDGYVDPVVMRVVEGDPPEMPRYAQPGQEPS